MAHRGGVLLEHLPDTLLELHCDGKLEEPVRSVVEEHLRECDFCPKRLAVFREYARMLAALKDGS